MRAPPHEELPLSAGCEAGPLHQPLGMTGLTGFLLPTGPLLQTSDGKEMEDGTIRYLMQPRGQRSGPGPWQGGPATPRGGRGTEAFLGCAADLHGDRPGAPHANLNCLLSFAVTPTTCSQHLGSQETSF